MTRKKTLLTQQDGKLDGDGEYEVISNCPVCKGAVFPNTYGHPELKHLYKCFHCSRFFELRNAAFILWAKASKAAAAKVLRLPYSLN